MRWLVVVAAAVCLATIFHRAMWLLKWSPSSDDDDAYSSSLTSVLSKSESTPPLSSSSPAVDATLPINTSQSLRELVEFMQSSSFPDLTLHQVLETKFAALWPRHWNDFDWIRQHGVVDRIRATQEAFLAGAHNGAAAEPVLYRPILPGMGWGNLVYDLSFHALLAFVLDRPLLILLDKKDPMGALGWNASTTGGAVLTPNVIDWRWAKPELLAKYPPAEMARPSSKHFIATCREGTALHSLCGGDQDRGNFGPVIDLFRKHPGKPIYSEFSASFIMPFKNAHQHEEWITTNLCEDRRQKLECQMQFAFSVLFRIDSDFRAREIFPRLRQLTSAFTAPYAVAHIRTGHRETGVNRGGGEAGFERDLASFADCQQHFTAGKWLLLTDTAEIAKRAANTPRTVTTLDDTYSLQHSHVGYNIASTAAWESTLRDWLLLVEGTGPNFIRSRMSSAFSFGERGGLIGGKRCALKRHVMLTCGDNFFDKGCAFDVDGYFGSQNGGRGRRLLSLLRGS